MSNYQNKMWIHIDFMYKGVHKVFHFASKNKRSYNKYKNNIGRRLRMEAIVLRLLPIINYNGTKIENLQQ